MTNPTELDYAELEERVVASTLGTPRDHTTLASEMFGVPKEQVTWEQRSAAKKINFFTWYAGLIWRQEPFK